ncbi:MAG: hypothetical protein KZQ78_12370 [Candidatus Thiodiazotropha sp. (ex Ustalcina ferruginea)]|nr:hypothetical protein [Candidatus Thiodiazotropha sp. (ex Ustalcina ferruginea)]
MSNKARFLLLLLMSYAPLVQSHGIEMSIDQGEASIVTLRFPNNQPFANVSYELFVAASKSPYQTGRTDAQGRVVFVPGSIRQWRIRVFSKDGHGTDTHLEVDADSTSRFSDGETVSPIAYLVLGIGILLSGFGLLLLTVKRGKS